MKKYTLLLVLVLIGSTSAWGGGFDSYIPGGFSCPNPCFAPPSPCFTPPTPCYTPPTPCLPPTGQCYQPAEVSYGSVTSNQSASLIGNGLAFALHSGGVVLWHNDGCGGGQGGGGQGGGGPW